MTTMAAKRCGAVSPARHRRVAKIEDSSSNDLVEYGWYGLGVGVGMHAGRMPTPRAHMGKMPTPRAHMGRMPTPRAYDALGRRIRMIDTAAEPDVTTLYYNPDWQVLTEYDGSTASGAISSTAAPVTSTVIWMTKIYKK